MAVNRDAGDWRQANLTVGPPWVAALGACAITAFCARLARRLETAVPTTKAEQLPSAGLRTTERAAWVGGASSPGMALVTVACLGTAGLGLLLAGEPIRDPTPRRSRGAGDGREERPYIEDHIAAPDAGSIEQISGDSRIGEKVRSWGIRRPASTAGHGRP